MNNRTKVIIYPFYTNIPSGEILWIDEAINTNNGPLFLEVVQDEKFRKKRTIYTNIFLPKIK